MNRRICFAVLLAFVLNPTFAQHRRDSSISDADTKAWWHTTEALSDDSMEGRDTGSPAYARAAEYVSNRFRAAGLKPAGDHGSFLQDVPMHELAVDPARTSFHVRVAGSNARDIDLRFLEDITVNPSPSMSPDMTARLVFRGYCGKDALTASATRTDVRGAFVLCFGTQRAGLPSAAERSANVRAVGAVGIINVDDPGFTIEPPRWPYAYARSVTLQNSGAPSPSAASVPRRQRAADLGENLRQPAGTSFTSLRLSADAFTRLLAGTDQSAASILSAGAARSALPSFDLPGTTLRMQLAASERDIHSPNVIAALPGSDPDLKDQYIVVSAHLDGYGFGTPVKGDKLYNGTLDDAAYVALLIQLAEDIHSGKLPAPKRSILFCAFTGEEKGLLGSTYFVAHPTVPIEQLAADINLDQLRPLFPLTILTAPGLHLTTLGATASTVGKSLGIELRDDREPERNLLRRADNFPFLRAGVPAIGFVFGFDAKTDAECRYREWYQVRYHRPQDDLTQPVDFGAAATFNTFFYKLVDALASAPERPRLLRSSQRPE